MASLVSSLLSSYLNVFVKGFSRDQLSFSLFSGSVTLKNACLHCSPPFSSTQHTLQCNTSHPITHTPQASTRRCCTTC